jgi:hypothetical protein
MHPGVDPAALLVAVLAVGIAPLTTVGPWDKMNTIVAGVAGVVVVAFTWPRKAILRGASRPRRLDYWIIVAQAVVYGFIVAIGAAWPVQSLFFDLKDCPSTLHRRELAACTDKADDISRLCSYWALGVGLLAAVVLFCCLRAATNRLVRRPPPPRPASPASARKRFLP